MTKLFGALLALGANAAPVADKVTGLPGLTEAMPSSLYSGYLRATANNQTFQMHYVLTESQRDPTTDPLVLWQQGGPGSSGFGYGFLGEWGPYRLTADSMSNQTSGHPQPFLNPSSWDRIANMLVFEHPPGTGFSYCEAADGSPTECTWNDQTQAEALEATLAAFFESFPEYSDSALHITGESYAGLLVPHLVDRLVDDPTSIAAKNLKGTYLGNGCSGSSGATPSNRGTCNGPYGSYDTEHVVDLVYGHSGISKALYRRISADCGFPCDAKNWALDECDSAKRDSKECQAAVNDFDTAVGDFNIYNFYDNCGDGNSVAVRERLQHADAVAASSSHELGGVAGNYAGSKPHTGGESYPCGTEAAAVAWANDPAVRLALHMKDEAFYNQPWQMSGFSSMRYTTYTGASFDLYPKILRHYPALTYSGDTDACVPWNSNLDWVTALAAKQGYEEVQAWQPWTLDDVPAGYVTSYATDGHDFTFVTVKNAGHMVPTFQPERALAFFERWVVGKPGDRPVGNDVDFV